MSVNFAYSDADWNESAWLQALRTGVQLPGNGNLFHRLVKHVAVDFVPQLSTRVVEISRIFSEAQTFNSPSISTDEVAEVFKSANLQMLEGLTLTIQGCSENRSGRILPLKKGEFTEVVKRVSHYLSRGEEEEARELYANLAARLILRGGSINPFEELTLSSQGVDPTTSNWAVALAMLKRELNTF